MGPARAILVLGLLSAGCDASPLAIVANQPPIPGSCELAQRETGEVIERGTFDLALGDRDTYLLTPIVRNRGSTALTVERAHVTMQWEVDGALEPLTVTSELGTQYDSWDLDLGACALECPVVPANGAASFEVPVLPRVVTAHLAAGMDDAVAEGRVPPEYRLVSTVVLEGTSEGASVRSDPFDYEVRLCLGCLVTFPPGTDSPAIDGPDCCGDGVPETTCAPGQDGPIDCRACIRTLPEICNFGRLSCGL